MSIKITSDSTCDLSPAAIEKHHIGIMPLYIIKDGEYFRDLVDITPADIFRHVERGGDICTTSAVNIADYAEMFSKLSQQYDEVIHVNLGSGFSSCYQNACAAAIDFPNVFVVDSNNLSSGHGHIVMEAVRLREAGLSARDICAQLNDIVPRVETSFILEKLDYMRKGGRCSAIAALGANLLHLRPCIEVKDGKMQVGKKYRGTFQKCISEYVSDRLAGRKDIIFNRIFVTTTASRETDEFICSEVQKHASFETIDITKAGCTISSHCGPNCTGILFIRSK